MDFFTNILEQFGAFFQLREQLSSLSNSNPIVAVVITSVITAAGAIVVVTQFMEFRKKFFVEWIHSRFAWTGLVVGACMAILASTGIVLNLRKAAAPVPVLAGDPDTVIGRPLLLQWKYDETGRSAVSFQLQSSKDGTFTDNVSNYYSSGLSALVGQVNDKRYWRVRAVRREKAVEKPVSEWSNRVQITQYQSSLKRIQDTHYIHVFISNSFNEGFFKWMDPNGNLSGYDIAVINHIVEELPKHLGISGPINSRPEYASWDELLLAPKSGHADIIISAITSLSQREDELSLKFSKPYFCTRLSLVYRMPQIPQSITRMIEGKKVGVQHKSTSEDLVEQFKKDERGLQPVLYDQVDRMIDDIVQGQINYALTDQPLAQAAESQYGPKRLGFKELAGEEDFPKGLAPERRVEKYAIAVRAGELKLITAVNEIIDEMREKKLLGTFLQDSIKEFKDFQKSIHEISDNRQDPSECSSN